MASVIGSKSARLAKPATPRSSLSSAPLHAAFSTATRPISIHSQRQRQTPPQASSITLRRHASTTTTTSTPSPNVDPTILTWDRFFDLRRKRRFLNLGSSIVTAVGAVSIGGPIIASQDLDGWATQISGLDPLVVLGLTTFAVAGGGWLCGPSIGNLGFKVWAGRRGWARGIAEKEKSLYSRIKRYRADPAASSPQNPLPDYYGEKIASVKDYRRWLKDQRAFNLKKNRAIV